jgi:hypothetical protein
MDGALNDPYFVPLILSCAAVITIGAIVTALNRIPRPEFARLKNELKELSGRVKTLEAAEQRRFLRELNSHNKSADADNGNGQIEAAGEAPVQATSGAATTPGH